MGLDFVEIVMRIEEEFSIDLPDAELGSVLTVGDLYELVLSKVKSCTAAECVSSKAFYRTRRALVDSIGVPRRSIRPSTPLESLLPLESRVSHWRDITRRIGLEFPKLHLPSFWWKVFTSLGGVAALIVVVLAWVAARRVGWPPGDGLSFWAPALCAWIVTFIIILGALTRWTSFLATEIPCQTAGELARVVLHKNFSVFAPASGVSQPLSREVVWERIVFIFCDHMQIGAEEVVPEARIVQDLGIG